MAHPLSLVGQGEKIGDHLCGWGDSCDQHYRATGAHMEKAHGHVAECERLPKKLPEGSCAFNLNDKSRRQNKPSLPVLIMAQHAPPALPSYYILARWGILVQYKDLLSFIHDICALSKH